MTERRWCGWFLAGLTWFILHPTTGLGQDWTPARFDKDVAPILIQKCLECHRGAEPKGELDLSLRAQVLQGRDSGIPVVPGKPQASLIWQRIAAGEMPPKQKLSAAEKRVLRDWISQGAIWGTDPIDPFRQTSARRAGYDWWSLQPVQRPQVPAGVPGNPVDAFVARRLAGQPLTASQPADARTLIRRLYFDLTGLPPDPDEVQKFTAEFGQNPQAARQRLIETLLASRHFGERWGRHWLDVVRFGESQGFERDKVRTDSWHYRDWVIDAFNRDLPYDEFVRQQIAGDIFSPNEPGAVIATGFLVAGPWDEVGQSQQSQAMRAVVRQDELEDYVGTIGQTFLGLTVNCARCHDHKFDPIRQQEYYQLAAALGGVRHGVRKVVPAAAAGQKIKPLSVYAVVPKDPEATFVLLRGNPASRGAAVSAGGVAALAGVAAEFELPPDAGDAHRRRKLAQWITDPDNPLFSRVIVNRLWHYHFGTGLVQTPNDFGFNGSRCSHPELLDWLASELIEANWSLKHIHRLIVSSNTYQQRSLLRPECAAVDAENRLLWRMAPRRLEAESLRDTILAVSGELNRKYGGPPYRDFETSVNNSQFYKMIDPDGPEFYRRTVYRTWIRSGRNHMLDAFDCPDPSTTAPKRAVTTTPIQSLTLMNGSFVLRMADRFAGRVSREAGAAVTDQIQRVYQLAYNRSAATAEQKLAAAFVAQHGLAAFCRVILNSNEFLYVD